MDNELIALVDENDKIIGYGDEEEVHNNGTLHQAITLLLVIHDKWDEYVLVNRSEDLWTSSCHTHIKVGEKLLDAAIRTAKETINLDIPEHDYTSTSPSLYEIGIFQYCRKSGLCIDHEINHVFLYWVDDKPIKEQLAFTPSNPIDNEVVWDRNDRALPWPDMYDLQEQMIAKPDTFDASYFMVYEMFVGEWSRYENMMCGPFMEEWYSVKCKKDAEISLREIADSITTHRNSGG